LIVKLIKRRYAARSCRLGARDPVRILWLPAAEKETGYD
jgi:hypothetical protein